MKLLSLTAAVLASVTLIRDVQAEEELFLKEEIDSLSLLDEEILPSLTDDDFEGLYVHLEDTCDGPTLMDCKLNDLYSSTVDIYLLGIDKCLADNLCLSFH